MQSTVRQLGLGLAAAVACAGVQATVVFQDDFESYTTDLGDWFVMSNYDAEDNRGIGLTGNANGGLQALEAFIEPPRDAVATNNRFVRAAREFMLADAGEYMLDLFASNTGFGYQIFIDGTQVGATQSSAGYVAFSQSLGVLDGGLHTLAIGLFQDVATAGNRYTAAFDDIVLSSVGTPPAGLPEPQSLALVLAALVAGAALRRRAAR